MSTAKGEYDVEGANWGKSAQVLSRFASAFSRDGAVVYDPFAGSGTVPTVCKLTGRHFIASEIDPATAERARQRVAQTQPPLPGLVVEQMVFEDVTA